MKMGAVELGGLVGVFVGSSVGHARCVVCSTAAELEAVGAVVELPTVVELPAMADLAAAESYDADEAVIFGR